MEKVEIKLREQEFSPAPNGIYTIGYGEKEVLDVVKEVADKFPLLKVYKHLIDYKIIEHKDKPIEHYYYNGIYVDKERYESYHKDSIFNQGATKVEPKIFYPSRHELYVLVYLQ